MVVTGPVGKLFGNLESYLVHNQNHGLVLIELYALVTHFNLQIHISMKQLEAFVLQNINPILIMWG